MATERVRGALQVDVQTRTLAASYIPSRQKTGGVFSGKSHQQKRNTQRRCPWGALKEMVQPEHPTLKTMDDKSHKASSQSSVAHSYTVTTNDHWARCSGKVPPTMMESKAAEKECLVEAETTQTEKRMRITSER